MRDERESESDLLKNFSDMNINIRPENLYIYQLYQVLKSMGKEVSIEMRKADFIIQVELLESTTKAVKKIDEDYLNILKEHSMELDIEINNESDPKLKHKLLIDKPYKIAQKKFENLYRILIYESQTNNDSIIC